MSRNEEVARLLDEFADLLAAKGVEYKPRAYERAARNIREDPRPIEDLAAEGRDALEEIDRVGEAISSKVVEYFETGEIAELTELRDELPVDMTSLTRVEGVGPKTVGTLYEALGIQTLADLEAAAEAGEIREVSGFGPKTEQNVLENVDFARQASERSLLGDARPRGESVRAYVDDRPAVTECELAGSLRRWRDTIGDVDVLAASDEPEAVVDAFTDWPEADVVIEAGTIKASVRSLGMRVDLRVVDPAEWGSALQYFSGSKEHNVAVRNRAIDRDLKINEYGVFDVSDVDDPDAGQRVGERVAGETEVGTYEAVDLPRFPPEIRQNTGEIAAADAGTLPELVEEADVRGDLHVHTDWSDGNNPVAEMVEGAAAVGHDYVAICDHAAGPGIVADTGLDEAAVREQVSEIREVADDADVEVFAGIETNVDVDGNVSLDDALLADLDLVVASPHSGLDGDGTDRLVAGAEHPAVDVVGHPTGRYINRRAGLDLDVERLAGAAADAGTALEVNANPNRLDLAGGAVRTAVEAGATLAVNTDAHRPSNYRLMRYGVHTARRGWAQAADVLNTRSPAEIRSFVA
jgi:DNA polymerase (family 10)